MADGGEMLPYRADAESLASWVRERARGRTPEQLRGAHASTKTAEGIAASAVALGLADSGGELTPLGRRLALAISKERAAVVRSAVLGFAPFAELLRAVAERGEGETEAEWMETWWATHGHGSSASNRREGAAVLGRLAEVLGLGRYVTGRRGHATRVEWKDDALRALVAEKEGGEKPSAAPAGRPPSVQGPSAAEAAVRGGGTVNRVVVPLGGGREARLEVPTRLPAEEKRRLLTLLELLISAE